jgi:IS30 family transposase
MGFDQTDPTARRRWEPEAQRERDAEITRLHRAGDMSQRDIAKMMNCSLGTVQHVIRREQKQPEQSLSDELDAALARYDGTALQAEDVTTADQIPELDDLQYHRLRYFPLDSPPQLAWGEAVAAGYRRAAT